MLTKWSKQQKSKKKEAKIDSKKVLDAYNKIKARNFIHITPKSTVRMRTATVARSLVVILIMHSKKTTYFILLLHLIGTSRTQM